MHATRGWHSMIGCLIGSLTDGHDIRDGLAQVAEATYLHPDARPSARRPCSGTGSAAHRAGKRLRVWTVDCSEVMERFVDADVDGISTDHVDALKAVLIQRGLRVAQP
jgi:glycerophosphoryl diester phosphodiesterase